MSINTYRPPALWTAFTTLVLLCSSGTWAFGQGADPPKSTEGARNLTIVEKDDGARRFAIVVGLDQDPLRYAEKDARDVAAALKAANAKWAVTILVQTDSEKKATEKTNWPQSARRIEEVIETIAGKAKEGDTLLFYYSGHGFEVENDVYLSTMAIETKSIASLKDTGLSLARVNRALASGPCKRILVILDACRKDPNSKFAPMGGFSKEALDRTIGTGILYSTAPGLRSFEPLSEGERDHEGREIRNGYFTHFLLQGLNGAARLNEDGFITFKELSMYVGDAMASFTAENLAYAEEEPFMKWDGKVVGDILIRPIDDHSSMRESAPVKPARETEESANAVGQTDPPKMLPPKLVSCSPTVSTELNAGTVVSVQLQFDAQVKSVSVGGVALQIDATKQSATGTISVPTGTETCDFPWVAVAVNGSRADGELTWRVKPVVVTPFEVLSRNPSWSGTVLVRGQSRNMTVAFVVTSNGIKESKAYIDGARRYFTMIGRFSGRRLEFDMRGNSKDIDAVFGVNVKVAAPAELSGDGRSITGKFSDKDSGAEIGSFTLHPD